MRLHATAILLVLITNSAIADDNLQLISRTKQFKSVFYKDGDPFNENDKGNCYIFGGKPTLWLDYKKQYLKLEIPKEIVEAFPKSKETWLKSREIKTTYQFRFDEKEVITFEHLYKGCADKSNQAGCNEKRIALPDNVRDYFYKDYDIRKSFHVKWKYEYENDNTLIKKDGWHSYDLENLLFLIKEAAIECPKS